MSETTTIIDIPGFPKDILEAALLVEDEIMAADLRELDTQFIIAKAIAAERERCAKVAEVFERGKSREWVAESLWANIKRDTAAAIRRGA